MVPSPITTTWYRARAPGRRRSGAPGQHRGQDQGRPGDRRRQLLQSQERLLDPQPFLDGAQHQVKEVAPGVQIGVDGRPRLAQDLVEILPAPGREVLEEIIFPDVL